MLDAQSGDLLVTYEGSPYRAQGEPAFTDMVGHPAEAMIGRLVKLGVFNSVNKSFSPDALMTQGEYLRELHILLEQENYLREPGSMYRQLISEKVISEEGFSSDDIITSGKAVQYLLRKVGHREVAEMSIIFKVPGRIPLELAGYAAIGSAYGLLSLNNWLAEQQLTRLAVAELFYAYLTRP